MKPEIRCKYKTSNYEGSEIFKSENFTALFLFAKIRGPPGFFFSKGGGERNCVNSKEKINYFLKLWTIWRNTLLSLYVEGSFSFLNFGKEVNSNEG